MLSKIDIKNFKSIEDLSIDLGRVNVLIGENGSGKSSILEALTFAAAAEANKLDTEFLENRGIRVTTPELMRPAFTEGNSNQDIVLKLEMVSGSPCREFVFSNNNETYSEWKTMKDTSFGLEEEIKMIDHMKELYGLNSDGNSGKKTGDDGAGAVKINPAQKDEFISKIRESLINISSARESREVFFDFFQRFVIYSPQNKQLRNLKEEGAIRPVGIHGEGLFRLLREVKDKQPEAMADVEKGLKLIGWYQSLDMDHEPDHPDDELYIVDRYLDSRITQRSANEGFLYMLFYMVLMVSKDTPKIFAIDNIDAALNPKLCARLTAYLAELAKKYDKQIFLTTQNPATLDGVDIFDDEQKLLVVSRKKRGQTTVKEFTADKMPTREDGEKILLSEAMIRGYIGGLPKGF